MDRSLNCLIDNATAIDDGVDDLASHSVEQLFNHIHKLFGSARMWPNA
jgi:hypothetical protein